MIILEQIITHLAQHDGLPPFIEVGLHADASYLIDLFKPPNVSYRLLL